MRIFGDTYIHLTPGVQILWSSWIPWGSSYFRRGPNTWALLWSNWTRGSKYFEVVGPGGTILGGSIFSWQFNWLCQTLPTLVRAAQHPHSARNGFVGPTKHIKRLGRASQDHHMSSGGNGYVRPSRHITGPPQWLKWLCPTFPMFVRASPDLYSGLNDFLRLL